MLVRAIIGLLFLSICSFASNSHARTLPAPLIFIHGFNGEAKTWEEDVRPWLTDQMGLSNGGTIETSIVKNKVRAKSHQFNEKGDYFFVQFQNRVSGIKEQVQQIYSTIHFLEKRLKTKQFILVGYSMGGLSSRAYLLAHPNDHLIKRLITVASPHEGTGFSTVYRIGAYCSNENAKSVIKQMCNKAKIAADKILGFPLNNNALKDLLPDNVPGSSKLLGKMARMKHPNNVEYASIIGQAPELFDKETFWMFMKEVFGENVGLLNALTSEPIDWVRRSLELFQESKKADGSGDGVVSLTSQDMSHLSWFRRHSNIQTQRKNEQGEFRSYKVGWANRMEVFKLNRHYHFRTPENIRILWRAIAGPTMLTTANLVNSYTISPQITGNLVSVRSFELEGTRNGKHESIPVTPRVTKMGHIELITEKRLDEYQGLKVNYLYASHKGNNLLENKTILVSNDKFSSIYIWIIIITIFLLLAYFQWFKPNRNNTYGASESWDYS